ncbi:type II secretion system F family protein [bacterium]|nr:type II secretion system F family protein [bacterium]
MAEQPKIQVDKIPTTSEGPGDEARSVLSYFNPMYGRITLTQLLLFTKYFATLTRAGVSIIRSLITLSRQMAVWKFRKIIWEMKESVEGGMPLHACFRRNEEIFGLLYINLIKTGEESGRLYTVLERLCALIERQIKLRRKVISALFYPAIFCDPLPN